MRMSMHSVISMMSYQVIGEFAKRQGLTAIHQVALICSMRDSLNDEL